MTRKLKYPLSPSEFEAIYSRVPRLTVEVILRDGGGIVLAQIARGVLKGQWNLPGGTVYFKETLHQAVQRVAKDELGVEVAVTRLVGYIEYPELFRAGYTGWPIGVVFEARITKGELSLSDQATAIQRFTRLPSDTVQEQRLFLGQHFPNLASS